MALIVLDAFANALCLLMMLRLRGRTVKPLCVGLAALFGAMGAVVIRRMGVPRIGCVLLSLPLSAAMAFAVDPRGTSRQPVRAMATLLAATGLLGGTVQALCSAAGSLSWGWTLGILTTIALSLHVFRANRARSDVRRAQVVCRYRGQTASFEAMVDSGNSLRDYLTHRPVIVVPEAQGRQLFHLEETLLRPIFADTAGGRQMMGCFAPESVQIAAAGRTRDVQAVLAFSPGLSPDALALLPATLLEKDS